VVPIPFIILQKVDDEILKKILNCKESLLPFGIVIEGGKLWKFLYFVFVSSLELSHQERPAIVRFSNSLNITALEYDEWNGNHNGSKRLVEYLKWLNQVNMTPRYHIFGHVHKLGKSTNEIMEKSSIHDTTHVNVAQSIAYMDYYYIG